MNDVNGYSLTVEEVLAGQEFEFRAVLLRTLRAVNLGYAIVRATNAVYARDPSMRPKEVWEMGEETTKVMGEIALRAVPPRRVPRSIKRARAIVNEAAAAYGCAPQWTGLSFLNPAGGHELNDYEKFEAWQRDAPRSRFQDTGGHHAHFTVLERAYRAWVAAKMSPFLPGWTGFSAATPIRNGYVTGKQATRPGVFRSIVPTAHPYPPLWTETDYRAAMTTELLPMTNLRNAGFANLNAVYPIARPTFPNDIDGDDTKPTVEGRPLEPALVEEVAAFQTWIIWAEGFDALTEGFRTQSQHGWSQAPPDYPINDKNYRRFYRTANDLAEREGIGGWLLNPTTFQPEAAAHVLTTRFQKLRPYLEEAGVGDAASAVFEAVLAKGTTSTQILNAFTRIRRHRDETLEDFWYPTKGSKLSPVEIRYLNAWAIAHAELGRVTSDTSELVEARAAELVEQARELPKVEVDVGVRLDGGDGPVLSLAK